MEREKGEGGERERRTRKRGKFYEKQSKAKSSFTESRESVLCMAYAY